MTAEGRETTCRDCGKPLQDSDECRASGLCLLCLNGPVPAGRKATACALADYRATRLPCGEGDQTCDPCKAGREATLTDDEKRTLLVLLMEDIRGWFDLDAGERTHAVIDLATELGYQHVVQYARAYAEDDGYRDGRHFRTLWQYGGYEEPPFTVTRRRAEASPALIEAVETLCMTPEYRLEEDDDA